MFRRREGRASRKFCCRSLCGQHWIAPRPRPRPCAAGDWEWRGWVRAREGEVRLASPRTGVRNRTALGWLAFQCAEFCFLTELSQTARDFGHHDGPGKGPVPQCLSGPGQTQELAGLLLRGLSQSCRWPVTMDQRCSGHWVTCPRPARPLGSHAGPMARTGMEKGLRTTQHELCVWGTCRFITAKAALSIP